jgi:hypothetical protein
MIHPLRPFALFTLLLIATTPHARAAGYEGRWAEDPAWCRNTRASGSDELPVTISRRLVETYASYCRVLSAVRTSRAAWRVRTSCRDKGQAEWEPRTPVTFVLRVNGNSLQLRDDAGVQNLTRCPP